MCRLAIRRMSAASLRARGRFTAIRNGRMPMRGELPLKPREGSHWNSLFAVSIFSVIGLMTGLRLALAFPLLLDPLTLARLGG